MAKIDESKRRMILGMYFKQLADDMLASGAAKGSGQDAFEATLRAAIAGTGAAWGMLMADVRAIGGLGARMTTPWLERFVPPVFHKDVKDIVDGVASFITGDKARGDAQRKTGKAFMDAAAKMGQKGPRR